MADDRAAPDVLNAGRWDTMAKFSFGIGVYTWIALPLLWWRLPGPLASRQLPTTIAGLLCATGFLIVGLIGLVHRHDRFEMDDEGLSLITAKLRHRWAWSDFERLSIETLTTGLTLYLHRGRERLALPLNLLAGDEAAKRLRERLDGLWQSRLREMASGAVTLAVPRLLTRMLSVVLLPLLVLAVADQFAPVSDLDPPDRLRRWGHLVQLLPLLVMVLVAYLTGRVTIGPDTVGYGRRRWPLSAIRTITVVRRRGAEGWRVAGPGWKAGASAGVDFPLVAEHVLRRCPQAAFEYDLDTPRSAIEASFLPLPPHAPPELLEDIGGQVAQRRARRRARQRRLVTLLLWVVAALTTVQAARMTKLNAATHDRLLPFQERGVEAYGRPEVDRITFGTIIHYQVAGRSYRLVRPPIPPPMASWIAGEPVALLYLADDPSQAIVPFDLAELDTTRARMRAWWIAAVGVVGVALAAGWLLRKQASH